MKTCSSCATEKPDSAFRKYGRGRKGKCMACEGGEPAAPVDSSEAPAAVTASNALEVFPGFGFRASVEGDLLQIEQDYSEGNTDSISLSRTEAKVLFAQYAEFAGLAA